MAASIFDTHEAFKNLCAAGFSEAQAEGILEVICAAVFGKTVAYRDSTRIRNESPAGAEAPTGDSVPATED